MDLQAAIRVLALSQPMTTAISSIPSRSVGIGLLTWGCLRFCREYLIAITYAPAVLMLAWSLFAEPVFRKYGGGLEPPKTDEA